jgi:hypothetical protein
MSKVGMPTCACCKTSMVLDEAAVISMQRADGKPPVRILGVRAYRCTRCASVEPVEPARVAEAVGRAG